MSDMKLIITSNATHVVDRQGHQLLSLTMVGDEIMLVVRDTNNLHVSYDPDAIPLVDVDCEVVDQRHHPISRSGNEENGSLVVRRVSHVNHVLSDNLELDDAEREEILNRIGDSWVVYPDQTAALTAEITHDIAMEVFGSDSHHEVMRVAGVRAALSRGVYDVSLEDLIAQAQDRRTPPRASRQTRNTSHE